MIKVGITGGIGSGKTVVCRLFEVLGIPVFYADDAGRQLTDSDPHLMSAIREIFGDDIYLPTGLDRKRVAAEVFAHPNKLQLLNDVVHPATIRYAEDWMQQQTTHYAIKEAAVFFESGSDKLMDVMIGVSAPLETRIDRVTARNGLSREEVLLRMARQMNEAEKMSRCNFVIVNDGSQALIPQVLAIHHELLGR